MTVILAIDAAWTVNEPSGVAVLASTGFGWRCLGVAPSYESFLALSQGFPVDWKRRKFSGEDPDVSALIGGARKITGAKVDIVTIDMPIANVPITGRRICDNLVSTEFGGRGCAAHSPGPMRPGSLGLSITDKFRCEGYQIATKSDSAGTTSRLVEVYPHPALLTLLERSYRIPYKVSKTLKYWPSTQVADRVRLVLAELRAIQEALSKVINGTGVDLPPIHSTTNLAHLKRYEDALDALVSGWVGIWYLEGRAIPYGDESAVIWCPS